MAERKCLMSFYPTKCKDNCFNCECGGAEATKDMYVSIHDVQRVCAIVGDASDTDEGEHIAEVIRNNLENMVISATDISTVRHGRWVWDANAPHREHGAYKCSNCGCHSYFKENYCYNCGIMMTMKDGDIDD